MKSGAISNIRYESRGKGEVTERVIIPTYVPSQNIKALDVTSLSSEDREELLDIWKAYEEYRDTQINALYNFEDWYDHTQPTENKVEPVKWRTFIPDNVEELD